jgi:hypothetical protein
MQRLLLYFLFITPLFSRAQDLTGVWQGHFRSNNMDIRSLSFDDRYKFEVQIAQNTKMLEAVTYSYLSSIFYGKATAAGTINVHTGKVLLQEGKLLEVRNKGGGVCIMTCFLQYSKSGDEEFLEGSYVSMNIDDSSNCGRGTVFLRKVSSSDFYKEPFLVNREKELKMGVNGKPASPDASPNASPKTPAIVKKSPSAKDGAVAGTTAPAGGHPVAGTTGSAGGHPVTGPPPPKKAIPVKGPDSTKVAGKTPSPATNSRTRPKPETASKPHPPPPALAKVGMPPTGVQAGGDSIADMSHKFPSITPSVLLTRTNQLVKALVVHTKDLVLNIYDDGIIDHDTISVYLDNKQVISHAMLTDHALVVTVHLDESNDYHELVLVAENEGDIPPNTSLMIVKAGDKEYEVRITSTEQKNAVITFRYIKQP